MESSSCQLMSRRLVARLVGALPVHAAGEVLDDLGIVLGFRGRLHALDRAPMAPAEPWLARGELSSINGTGRADVGGVVLRRVPQVEVHVEVQQAQGAPRRVVFVWLMKLPDSFQRARTG